MRGGGKMTCHVTAQPSGRPTRSFWLRRSGADASMTCVVGSAARTCTAVGGASAPVTEAAGDILDFRERVTGAGTGAPAHATCMTYASYDGGPVL